MASMELPFGDFKPRTCVVLGGRGFLGRSLVSRLLKLGDWIVRVADLPTSLQPDDSDARDSSLRDAISSGRASYHHVDLRDYSLLVKAIEGSSVVFHMELIDASKHDYYFCYMMIVQGAKNVINACRECKVRQLIYNSSADVIFDGSHDIWCGDESLPCQWRFEDLMSDLKAQAEALVLFANNIDGLLTCALRPSNIFGPGDPELIPMLVKLARSGWAKFIIGNGENMSDFTYSENVTHAHICAAKALDSKAVFVAGKAFFITNLQPMRFWEFVSKILEGLEYQRPVIKIPALMVWFLLLVLEWIHVKLDSNYNHSVASRFYHTATCTRTFDCLAAQTHIGYSPVVNLQDGISMTITSFSHLAKGSSAMTGSNVEEQSKAEKLLGGGKVADILLWRDEKKTFTCFLIASLLYYWFLFTGGTFASCAAKLMLFMTIMIYGCGILPPKLRSRFATQRSSSYSSDVSEMFAKDFISYLAFMWNHIARNIKVLAQGEDWSNFFRVVLFLYLFKSYFLESVNLAIGVALVFVFMAFLVYEQYETELDGLAKIISFGISKSCRLLINILVAPIASCFQTEGRLHEQQGPGNYQ